MFKFKCKLPSKKVVYCEEITNETYISLHKYVMNNDLLGFYKELDGHIAKTIPEIYSLDLLDKVYIYLSIRVYSISDAIELKTDNFFNKDLYSLFDTLDNLRETFFEPIETIIETKSGNAKFKINCPFLFEEIDDEVGGKVQRRVDQHDAAHHYHGLIVAEQGGEHLLYGGSLHLTGGGLPHGGAADQFRHHKEH